ncbi:MAG: helix-turn-helix transcriptional regulator [Sphingomonadaceae bacterium]|nr:helix-turn-helix transcriptional regulator [Sphingomonadaceae bacterium]
MMDLDAYGKLTERQKQCLRMVAAGKRSKTIGAALGISHLTVNQHVEAAKARIGAATREEAAQILIAHEQTTHTDQITSYPPSLGDTLFFDRIGASPTPDDALPTRPADVMMEEQAAYRAAGLGVEELLRLPLRTRERPRNDLSTLQTLFAVAALILLLAIGGIAVAAIVETITRFDTSHR